MYPLRPIAKFVILFAALYSAFGVISPFLPAIFEDHGLSAQQISLTIGLGTAIRLLAGPLVGGLADRWRAWRWALMVCALVAGTASLAYGWAYGFVPVLLVAMLQSIALAPLAPIADAMALSASLSPTAMRFEYGWVRAAGSAAFIVGLLAVGEAAASRGLIISVWLNAALLSSAALAATSVPDIEVKVAASSRHPTDLLFLLRLRPFRRLLLVASLVLGSHALHDTFAVISWRDAGISTQAASMLWSESVLAEVVVFLLIGPPIVHRLGPANAAMLAAAAAVVRWSVLGATTWVPLLALAEPLHGFTFALLHLAGMRLIAATVPSQHAATGQAVYGTLAVGMATTVLTLMAGPLYGRFGAAAFWIMALICLAAIPLARGMTDSPTSVPRQPLEREGD
jgi:MFS transporter, PPP family, 3-phenylpropionic acid transporter